jgi:hypothetical protein
MPLRLPILLLMAFCVCGCTIFGGPADKALRRTPSYRDGYQDGCAAATDAGANLRTGPRTDNELYKTDAIYRHGWANGYQACRSTLTPGSQANMPGANPILNPNPGHQ